MMLVDARALGAGRSLVSVQGPTSAGRLLFALLVGNSTGNIPPKVSGPGHRKPLTRLRVRRQGIEPRTYGLRERRSVSSPGAFRTSKPSSRHFFAHLLGNPTDNPTGRNEGPR